MTTLQDSIVIIDGLTKVVPVITDWQKQKILNKVLELASSRMASLLGYWTQEPDYCFVTVGVFPGRWC